MSRNNKYIVVYVYGGGYAPTEQTRHIKPIKNVITSFPIKKNLHIYTHNFVNCYLTSDRTHEKWVGKGERWLKMDCPSVELLSKL